MLSTLYITITDGKLNKNFDTFGKMQNYVIIKLFDGGKLQEYRTKIVQGGVKVPIIWNETAKFEILKSAQSTAYLEVQIMDEDIVSDDVCGVGKVNLQRFGFFAKKGDSGPYNIKLFDVQKKTEINGQLNIKSLLQ